MSLGAKERDLELIRRQKYISPKSEAWHGPCQMWHGRATTQDCLLLLLLLVQATY